MKIDQLTALRLDKDITQSELAKKLGRSQSWLCGVEMGKIRPSKKMTAKIIEIAKRNGIDIKYEQLRPKKERKKQVKQST